METKQKRCVVAAKLFRTLQTLVSLPPGLLYMGGWGTGIICVVSMPLFILTDV